MNKVSSKTEGRFEGQAMNSAKFLLIWLLASCWFACPVPAGPIANAMDDSTSQHPEQSEVHWSVLASGGGQGNVGGYLLGATVGQPCAGRATIGSLSLIVGFWQDFGSADQECCGRYTGGETGNTDCDTEGERTLSDITILIGNIYITHAPLCCEANGNVDGDPEGELSLSDIIRLIDNIYINHTPCAPCP